MRLDPRWSRAVLTTVGIAVATASFAPAASADRWRKYKGAGPWGPPRHVVVAPAPRVVWVSGHSSAAPAFAGFVGGLILGSALTHAAVVAAPPPPQAWCPPPPVYDFVDPYCHERFESLDAYAAHLRCAPHPAVAMVIDEGTGRCVGEQVWWDGRWCERDAPRDWDDDDGYERR